MNSQEKKQIKAGLATMRAENLTITNRLSSIGAIVESTGKSQLRIEAIIIDLEAKLKKK